MDALGTHALATDLLAVAVEALNTLPTLDASLRPAPERAYVSPGVPVIDCEQITVHVSSIFEAGTYVPGGPTELAVAARRSLGYVNEIGLVIISARCLHAGTQQGSVIVAPTVEQMTADAKQHDADGWVVWNALQAARKTGRLNGICSAVQINPATPRDQSGGYSGWTWQIAAQLDAFTPEIGS